MEKRLQRDLQHRVLGGVCSGLANYFDIDTSLVRVLFAVALLVFGSGFWLYVLLWILMPEAPSGTAQQVTDMPETVDNRSRKSGWVTGLVLIVSGCCFLLGNLLPQFNWKTFWPVLLIVAGLLLIVPLKDRKS